MDTDHVTNEHVITTNAPTPEKARFLQSQARHGVFWSIVTSDSGLSCPIFGVLRNRRSRYRNQRSPAATLAVSAARPSPA